MNPGSIITIAVIGLFAGLVVYGLLTDVRWYLEDRRWDIEQGYCEEILEYEDYLQDLRDRYETPPMDAEELAAVANVADWMCGFAEQLDEIRELPEVASR